VYFVVGTLYRNIASCTSADSDTEFCYEMTINDQVLILKFQY